MNMRVLQIEASERKCFHRHLSVHRRVGISGPISFPLRRYLFYHVPSRGGYLSDQVPFREEVNMPGGLGLGMSRSGYSVPLT